MASHQTSIITVFRVPETGCYGYSYHFSGDKPHYVINSCETLQQALSGCRKRTRSRPRRSLSGGSCSSTNTSRVMGLSRAGAVTIPNSRSPTGARSRAVLTIRKVHAMLQRLSIAAMGGRSSGTDARNRWSSRYWSRC